jgi:hypothetical protein
MHNCIRKAVEVQLEWQKPNNNKKRNSNGACIVNSEQKQRNVLKPPRNDLDEVLCKEKQDRRMS